MIDFFFLTFSLRRMSGLDNIIVEKGDDDMGKKILSILGLLIALVGIVFGGDLILVIVGCVILGVGQMMKDDSTSNLNEGFGKYFEDVKMNPESHILKIRNTNIPLPKHDYESASDYVQGKYKGLDVEFCTIQLTDVTEMLREETGLWEKNENTVYTGEWMLCKLDRKFSTWLTIYPRGFIDLKPSKTQNEAFNKKFNLCYGNEKLALEILDSNRLERIMALSNHKFSINLNEDGRLYIAAHNFKNMNDLKWFVDMIDVFRE